MGFVGFAVKCWKVLRLKDFENETKNQNKSIYLWYIL